MSVTSSGVGFALLAGRHSGLLQVVLIAAAVLTVVLSWTVVNTVFTLRYADQQFGSGRAGIDFGDSDVEEPTYRDFAYVAFTVGMCYQVSDTTPAQSADSPHGALPRPTVVRVRRGERRWLGQSHRRSHSLIHPLRILTATGTRSRPHCTASAEENSNRYPRRTDCSPPSQYLARLSVTSRSSTPKSRSCQALMPF